MSLKPTPIPPIPEETARGTRAVFPRGADVVRSRLDWKYAHTLELTDPGFDHTVLSEFRTRLVAHAEERPLEACKAQGWLKAHAKQRTDSTHVLAKIRTLNRAECVVETRRHALNVLAMVPRTGRSAPAIGPMSIASHLGHKRASSFFRPRVVPRCTRCPNPG